MRYLLTILALICMAITATAQSIWLEPNAGSHDSIVPADYQAPPPTIIPDTPPPTRSIMLQPPATKPPPRGLFPIEYHYQGKEGAKRLRIWAIGNALALVAGAAYGIHEVVDNKPHRIPSDWNQQWWDQRQSWRNKYRNNDPEQPRRLVPVAFTDADHLFSSIHRWGLLGAGMCITLNGRNDWRQVLGNVLVSAACYQVGFRATYNTDLFFR